jgi:hypothetical protein
MTFILGNSAPTFWKISLQWTRKGAVSGILRASHHYFFFLAQQLLIIDYQLQKRAAVV